MEKRTELVLGLAALVIILTIAFAALGIYSIALKLFGVLLLFMAVFLIVYFPGAKELQDEAIAKTGIILGIILFIAGVWLIFF